MKLNGLFCDGVVFQAGKHIRVFGDGDGTVEIYFMGKTYSCCSKDGKWLVEMPPMSYGGPYEMTVSLNGEKQLISDLYIGDVLLVAGQSNVQFRVKEETPSHICDDDKLLRFFAVDRIEEDNECFQESDGWKSAVGNDVLRHSAIGYGVGRLLRKHTGAAIGIVECYQGASIIQSWMKKSDAERKEFFIPMNERHQDFTNEGYKTYLRWNENGELFDKMFLRIAPVSFSGIVWYQGESNTSVSEGAIYDKMLATMVQNWREALDDYNVPFFVVVIANLDYRRDAGWYAVQAAQRRAADAKKNIFVIESADISDSSAIHPADKQKLCERIFQALKNFSLNI